MSYLTPLQLFKNLSDETGLTIVLLLKGRSELCVCELCGILKLPQPKISRHLAMLRENGILLDRREGKWIHYRLSPNLPMWAGAIVEQAYKSEEIHIRSLLSILTQPASEVGQTFVCG